MVIRGRSLCHIFLDGLFGNFFGNSGVFLCPCSLRFPLGLLGCPLLLGLVIARLFDSSLFGRFGRELLTHGLFVSLFGSRLFRNCWFGRQLFTCRLFTRPLLLLVGNHGCCSCSCRRSLCLGGCSSSCLLLDCNLHPTIARCNTPDHRRLRLLLLGGWIGLGKERVQRRGWLLVRVSRVLFLLGGAAIPRGGHGNCFGSTARVGIGGWRSGRAVVVVVGNLLLG
mmetsp:Transcript_23876/g.51577  ORF Transcript_23876/g.51577 Transcript_23876/m.51577 type:complete len:224 (-) Transcript_23876:439-1110(-)